MGQTQRIATKNSYVRQAAANTRQRQKMWRLPSIVRKRGSSVCVHCGCSNGNRAFTCKECKNPLPGKTIKRPKWLSSTDVSDLRTNSQETPSGTKIFSTKVRRDGPDYRTLVVYAEGKWKCFYKDCIVAQDARGRSASTLELDASGYCQHITTVQAELQWHTVEHLTLNVDVLSQLPIPPSIKQELQQMKAQAPVLIQRVSGNSFLIRDRECSQERPLGLLHVRFSTPHQQPLPDNCEPRPPTTGSEPRPSFYCPCRTFQRFSSLLPGAATTPKLSRRCLHFYILCLWAFACNSNLRDEFSFYLSSVHSEGERL